MMPLLVGMHRSSCQGEGRTSRTEAENVKTFDMAGGGAELTRKRALARNVYENTVQPIHPPVPLPPERISATASVTITPTYLYPEYATKSRSCESLLMLKTHIATFKIKISRITTPTALVVIEPSSSGWNFPRSPASTVESSMYVIRAMMGMYMSGEFMSSRGGRYMEEYCC